jgi:hypothetical protein
MTDELQPTDPAEAVRNLMDMYDRVRVIKREILTENLVRLVDALRQQNVAEVHMEYAGGGDSGDIESLSITNVDGEEVSLGFDGHYAQPDDLPAGTPMLSLKKVVRHYDTPEREPTVEEGRDRPLKTAMMDFLWSLADLEHPGWENNDGGEGEVHLDVASGQVTLEHREFITQTESYEYNYGPDDVEE